MRPRSLTGMMRVPCIHTRVAVHASRTAVALARELNVVLIMTDDAGYADVASLISTAPGDGDGVAAFTEVGGRPLLRGRR